MYQSNEYLALRDIVLDLINDKIHSHLESRKNIGTIEITPEEIYDYMKKYNAMEEVIEFFRECWAEVNFSISNYIRKKSYIVSVWSDPRGEMTITFFIKE